MTIDIANGNYTISTGKEKLDIPFIHAFLSKESYWALNVPLETVQRSIANSLCFGVYHNPSSSQVGFARIITDYATIAYLGDVFITTPHRGHGLSKMLMQQIMAHPDLQGLRRWVLLTADAHDLYRQFGWQSIPNPEKYMEVHNPNPYDKPQ